MQSILGLKRLTTLIKRRHRVSQVGVEFKRVASFEVPKNITIKGKRKTLSLPNENGVKVSFIEILLDDCYGLRDLQPPISTILDIGANVGLFGVAARMAFPDATIHAYEPNPYILKYLKVQADTFNFNYFAEAIGLKNCTVSLDINKDDSVQTRTRFDSKGDVPQVSFAKGVDRLGGHVDLLKLDCEGAEWKLFQNKDIWHSVSNVAMEYHLWPNHSHEEVNHVVRDMGYTIKSQVPATKTFGLLIAYRKKAL